MGLYRAVEVDIFKLNNRVKLLLKSTLFVMMVMIAATAPVLHHDQCLHFLVWL